jgi:signal transduction histidine kinase
VSLHGRIRLLSLGATVAVLVLFAIPLWLLENRSASRDVEESATETARGVADYLSAAGLGDDLEAYVDRINAREGAAPVEVLLADGQTYGEQLPGAREQRPSDDDAGAGDDAGSGDGDHDGEREGPFLRQSRVDVDHVEGGRLVRLEVRTGGGPTVVLAYASDEKVRSTLVTRLLPLGGAALLLLVLVGVAAEVVARRLVRDLDRTADLADTIAAGDAVARVPESGPPEVRRVAHAAGRIDELLAAERETVADLSHRLRTPLTALRLDVEALPDGEARTELEDHVNTLERTLTAVIHQARRSEREGTRVGCRPGPVVAESVAYWQPLIEDQDRAMEVAVDPDLPEVHCSADDLRAAIDALVENCIAHTPDHTAVAVRAAVDPADPRYVAVEVRDEGPGFDPEAIRRGRSDRGSTGLGLDIARRCARASGGDLVVRREEPWTVVRLELGLA